MPTFLTTSKMSPALAARVVASVRGERRPSGARRARASVTVHAVTLVRFGVPLMLLALVWTIVHLVREDRRELERARASLIDGVHEQTASLTPDDRAKVGVVDTWLARLAGPYAGDVITEPLQAPGALASTLRRGALYVRGPLAGFVTGAAVADVAAASTRDAFVRCLMGPPGSRTEKALLTKVLTAPAGGGAGLGAVYRLGDAEETLPLLAPAWAESVRLAPDLAAVTRERRQVDSTPVERGVMALKAELLLAVMDEPHPPGTVSELDGEGPHEVRVALVDLAADAVLVRLRRHVDPQWISQAKRPMYASALDGCLLAVDVGDALVAPAK